MECEDTSTKLEHVPLKIKDAEIWKIPNMAAWSGAHFSAFLFLASPVPGLQLDRDDVTLVPEDWIVYTALPLMVCGPWGGEWRLPVLQMGRQKLRGALATVPWGHGSYPIPHYPLSQNVCCSPWVSWGGLPLTQKYP